VVSQPHRISVVMPCFNHGEFVNEAVESVLGAKRPDLELIVVDDGSTDERTLKEMKELSAQGIHVVRQVNRGLSAARNAGIMASCGEFIFPLDADDRMRGGWIDRAKRIMDRNSRVGVVYGDEEFFGARRGRWPSARFEVERLLERNWIPASALYRRAVWEQNGGYDERMLLGFEDWDFWLGAVERGWEFVYLPEVFFDYRQSGESMLTRAEARKTEVEDYIARKHGTLYRRAWLQHVEERRERLSVRRTASRLARLVLSRAKNRVRSPFLGVRSSPD
jgi:glycosyltransferase involved in cell wall biosynthesis